LSITDRQKPALFLCEATVPDGLEPIAGQELRRRLEARFILRQERGRWSLPGSLRFDYSGDLKTLLGLKTVLSVYLVCAFDIPRPRALLSNEHLPALLRAIEQVRGLLAPETYRTFHLSAAGSESAVLLRLKQEIAARAHLQRVADEQEAHLQMHLRPAPEPAAGWELLLRLSPRPLAVRAWRVCNRKGALNAAVAHAMVLLTQPAPQDTFLNPACGSGTLLIERIACGPARRAVGCDIDGEALACAHENIEAGGCGERVEAHRWDMLHLPLPDDSVDSFCSMLPFGHRMGSHAENLALYPRTLQEAARVAKEGARFALLASDRRVIESSLQQSPGWAVEQSLRVSLSHAHPLLLLLRRQRRKSASG
jgi:23S rRNA G2445 N2-methylase RlmL